MARYIPVCGMARWVRPAHPPSFAHEEIWEYIGSPTVEISWLERIAGFRCGSLTMLAQEQEAEGLLPNEAASFLARQPIRGDVLLISPAEDPRQN